MPVVTWPVLGLWMGIASLVFGLIDDLPQDNQLFGWHLSHHHRCNGDHRVLPSLEMTLVVLSRPLAVVLGRVPTISI